MDKVDYQSVNCFPSRLAGSNARLCFPAPLRVQDSGANEVFGVQELPSGGFLRLLVTGDAMGHLRHKIE